MVAPGEERQDYQHNIGEQGGTVAVQANVTEYVGLSLQF